jgi:alpha-amylase
VPAIDASLVGSSIDYRLRGDEPVHVEYLGTESYAITAATSVPVRVGWQRLPGEQLTLTVDGAATTVTADAAGEVWTDAVASGRHVYELSGSQGIVYDDDAVEFSPEWWQAPGDTFAGGSLRGTSTTGATATLRFTGTGAAVLASVGGDKGLATVTVDGQQVAVGDWYADSAGHLVRTVTVDGLAPGEHELVLTVRGEHAPASVGTQVTLDAVVVYGGGLTPPDPDAPTETAVHPVNFSYTGGWWGVADPAFLLGELRGTSEAGATVSYTFTGTGVTVSGSTGGDKGRARVEIDGVEVGIADWYSTSPAHRVRIFSIDDLDPGQHTITLTVLDTPSPGSVGTQVNLDALLVRTGVW